MFRFVYVLFVLIVSSSGLFQTRNGNVYHPLLKSKCTWMRARQRFHWQENPQEGCKTCRCQVRGKSLWQICKTYPRPTSWMKECKVVRRGCTYAVVPSSHLTVDCMVFANTVYQYEIWIANMASK